MSVINLYKPMGLSPLQAMLEYKHQNSSLSDSIMVYAGRLDPMAEGVMLVLSDQDRFDKDDYLHLNKTYEATVLFGYTSDTFDALGLVKPTGSPPSQGGLQGVADTQIIDKIKALKHTHNLPFPNYSSYKVKGKPLHWWTKQNRLDEIEIPLKEMKVLNVDRIEVRCVSSRASTHKLSREISSPGSLHAACKTGLSRDDKGGVLENITNRIKLVDGNFRQDKIVANWKELLIEDQQLTTATFTIEVSSGTYIRSLANLLGKNLGCGALLLNLKRTRVGEFDILDSERL